MISRTSLYLLATLFAAEQTVSARTTYGKCVNFDGKVHQDIDHTKMMGDWYTVYAD